MNQKINEKIITELKIQGKSDRTIKMYSYFNKDFLDYINKSPNLIDEDDIKKYLSYLIDYKKYNPSSLSLALAALRFYYDAMLKKKITTDIKSPKKNRTIPDILTKEEILKLIDSSFSLKTKLMIEFMYASGLRVSECASLKIEEINIKDKTGLLRLGKGKKDRFFILSDRLIKDMIEFLDGRTSGYVFTGKKDKPITTRAIQSAVSRTASRAKLNKHVYCHLLRHAFATHLLEEGVDIRIIQELLAHTNLQTTQWYTQVSKEKLRKVKSPLDT